MGVDRTGTLSSDFQGCLSRAKGPAIKICAELRTCESRLLKSTDTINVAYYCYY